MKNYNQNNSSKANEKPTNVYVDYLPVATKTECGVSEAPEFAQPVLVSDIQISLRGVVGFSYILTKILVSLDAELLCSSNAEQEFLIWYKEKHTNPDGPFIMRTLKPDKESICRQAKRYIQQCGFSFPQTVEELTDFW